jgi:hypothetical protein
MGLTPETQREIGQLLRSLARLVLTGAKAFADGILSVEEVIHLGLDAVAVGEAIAALARPNAPPVAAIQHRVEEGHRVIERKRRAARQRARRAERKRLGSVVGAVRVVGPAGATPRSPAPRPR